MARTPAHPGRYDDRIPELDAGEAMARMQAEHEALFEGGPIDERKTPRPTGTLLVCSEGPRETFTPEQVATLMQVPIEVLEGALSRDGMIEGLRFSIYHHVPRKYRKRLPRVTDPRT